MSSRLIALAALVTLALFSTQARGQAHAAQAAQNSTEDETAIRKIVQQIEDGWNAHDGKAFAAPFAADADYVVINGTKIRGKEAIERGHTSIFATIYKDSHNSGTVKSIRLLRPDVAVVHVEWNLEWRENDQAQKGRSMNTLVMMKEGGRWSITAFQNTRIQVEPR